MLRWEATMRLSEYQKDPVTGAEWIADQAIGLFLEYRDVHGYPEDEARQKTLAEVRDGVEALLGGDDAADVSAPDLQDGYRYEWGRR